MKLLGYLILAFARILSLVINIYTFIIAAAVILSWVNADPYNPIVKIIRQLTDPIFYQVRRFVPRPLFKTGLDFTPIIVLIILVVIETVVVNLLFDLGRNIIIGGRFPVL